MKRLYICLEGIDGVGKSTLATMLDEYLRSSGYKTEVLRTTKPAPASHRIEKIFVKHPGLHNSRFLRFFLFAHRSNYAASMIKADTQLIIGDRSIITSYAYRWTKHRLLNRLHIICVDLSETRLPAPDYVIYCHADDDQIRRRIDGRNLKRTIDENPEKAALVKAAYTEILSDRSIKRLRSVKTLNLDCGRGLNDVFAELKDTVNKILSDNKE